MYTVIIILYTFDTIYDGRGRGRIYPFQKSDRLRNENCCRFAYFSVADETIIVLQSPRKKNRYDLSGAKVLKWIFLERPVLLENVPNSYFLILNIY